MKYQVGIEKVATNNLSEDGDEDEEKIVAEVECSLSGMWRLYKML